MSMNAISTVRSADHAPDNQSAIAEKITIRDLSFFYGEMRALKSISLPLYLNKVTAFIGPSGCGKSTLLRVLNRMYDLYPHQRATGEVMFDGENILSSKQDLNLLRARIGMVFQKPTPFPMSTKTSPSVSGYMRSCRNPRSTAVWRLRFAGPLYGTR